MAFGLGRGLPKVQIDAGRIDVDFIGRDAILLDHRLPRPIRPRFKPRRRLIESFGEAELEIANRFGVIAVAIGGHAVYLARG